MSRRTQGTDCVSLPDLPLRRARRGPDAVGLLRSMPAESIHVCVTSPPYWGLRQYGVEPSVWGGDVDHLHDWGPMERGKRTDILPAEETTSTARLGTDERQSKAALNGGRFCDCGAWLGELGLEPTPQLFVEHLVVVLGEVRRVLRPEGTLWLNLGDSYAAKARGSDTGWDKSRLTNPGTQQKAQAAALRPMGERHRGKSAGLKNKDLIGVPWRVALALQDAGWWLRSDIVWSKPNAMPESVRDRPTRAHEFVFLLAKAERYHYDVDAIREPHSDVSLARYEYGLKAEIANHHEINPHRGGESAIHNSERMGDFINYDGRNRRTVWEIPTQPYREAHFATFPPKLVEPMVLAGCPEGGTVLDPFAGSGTTGLVALRHGRSFVGLELNADYVELARRRITDDAPLFNTGAEVSA